MFSVGSGAFELNMSGDLFIESLKKSLSMICCTSPVNPSWPLTGVTESITGQVPLGNVCAGGREGDGAGEEVG